MAIELEKKDLRSLDSRKKRYKQRLVIVAIICFIIALMTLAFFIYRYINKGYSEYKIIQSIEREDSSSAQYVSYDKGMIRYSNDGVMALDFQGNPIWNTTYDMKHPVIDICEDYFVISDRGSKTLELFNGSGHVSTIEVLNPIIKSEVANQGVMAVLMEGEEVNYIQLLSSTGQNLVELRTTTMNNGFPIDLSLSNDGKKLATSYITINNGLVQNNVTFYNFGGVGQNYEARIVGGFDYGQTLVPKIEFINNDTICAFGDNKISIYSMKEIPELVFEESFQEEINSIFYNKEYIGVIQNSLEGNEQYRLTLYDYLGKKELNRNIDFNYNQIFINDDEIVFYSNTEWNIIRINGNEKLSITFDRNISDVIQTNNKLEYIVIDDTQINKIKLID